MCSQALQRQQANCRSKQQKHKLFRLSNSKARHNHSEHKPSLQTHVESNECISLTQVQRKVFDRWSWMWINLHWARELEALKKSSFVLQQSSKKELSDHCHQRVHSQQIVGRKQVTVQASVSPYQLLEMTLPVRTWEVKLQWLWLWRSVAGETWRSGWKNVVKCGVKNV